MRKPDQLGNEKHTVTLAMFAAFAKLVRLPGFVTLEIDESKAIKAPGLQRIARQGVVNRTRVS